MKTNTNLDLLNALARAFDSTADEQVRCAVDYYLVARTMPDYCARCADRLAQYLPFLVQREPFGYVAAYRCPESHVWTCRFGLPASQTSVSTCSPSDFKIDRNH